MLRTSLKLSLISLAAALVGAAPAIAADAAWSGTGPFPPGNGSERINALTLDAATGVLYAGSGSGTVFALADSGLSKPPVALDDNATTQADTAVAIDILDNDFDPEGALDPGSVAIKGQAANGTVTIDGSGGVAYTPADGFVGTDSFTYTVRDAAGLASNVATVSITVQAPPDDGNNSSGGSTGSENPPDSDGNPSGPGVQPPALHNHGGGAWGLFAWLLALPGLWSRRRRRNREETSADWPPRRR